MARVPPPFQQKYAITKWISFVTQCFARKLDWVHGKRRWVTAWAKMNPECNWDDIFWGLNQPTIFYIVAVCLFWITSTVPMHRWLVLVGSLNYYSSWYRQSHAVIAWDVTLTWPKYIFKDKPTSSCSLTSLWYPNIWVGETPLFGLK